MTLIIGIKCKDGIVMGSDGAATLGSLNNHTALQPTKKLSILSNQIMVGVSGPVGLGQRIKGQVNSSWDSNGLSGMKSYEAMVKISEEIRKHILPEINVASQAQKAIGGLALQSALTQTLIALPIQREAVLFQFDHQGSPEETTEDLPFSSIGSGQGIADPFLGLIRRVFWDGGCPNVTDAVFATVWTLQHAILINPGGVSNPIYITTLKKINKDDWEAKEIPDSDLQEHKDSIAAVEKTLHDFKKSVQSEDKAKEIPKPDK